MICLPSNFTVSTFDFSRNNCHFRIIVGIVAELEIQDFTADDVFGCILEHLDSFRAEVAGKKTKDKFAKFQILTDSKWPPRQSSFTVPAIFKMKEGYFSIIHMH